MNIWLIQIGEPLPLNDKVKKMRTALLADELARRQHSIVWWTSSFDHFTKEWIYKEDRESLINNRIKIIFMKGSGYKKNISLSRFIDHRLIAWKFKTKAAKLTKPDIIIASMPPHDLAYEAVMFGKVNNIPVIIDIRDPWPDIFLDRIPGVLKVFARVLLYDEFRIVKKTMQTADCLTAATDTFLKWGLKYAKREKTLNDRVFSLGYKKHELIEGPVYENKFKTITEKIKNKFIVFFVGTISASYHNPFILLKAAEELSGNENIHFVIAGDGELFEELKTVSKNLNNVSLVGWLNQNEIEFWLKQAKVGVCPVTKKVNLPTNKVYAYLSSGLPIISAFDGDLKNIIEKYQIGLYYTPDNVNELVNCIKTLCNNKIIYKKISKNAKKVFNEMFDADKIYKEYAEHIEKMIFPRKSGHKEELVVG